MRARFLFAALLGSCLLLGHGPLDEQIQTVSRLIVKEPENPSLYLKRAELHRLHRDCSASLSDLGQAAQLGPAAPDLHLGYGRTWIDCYRPDLAVKALDQLVAVRPKSEVAYVVRADAHMQLGDFAAAAQDFAQAIEHSAEPGVDYFLGYARALESAGSPRKALNALDAAVSRLGNLVTLQQEALEIELRASNWDGALTRLDMLAKSTPRKERWLVRRGEILLVAGRADDARIAFQEARAALESLPPNVRRVPALVELEARIQAALLQPPGKNASPAR